MPLAGWAHHVERSAAVGDEQASAELAGAAGETRWRAPATAARWYGAALRLLPARTGDAARCGVLLARAEVLCVAGDLAASRATLTEAGPLLAAADPPTRVRATALAARVEQLRGRHEEAVALLRRALATAPGAAEAAALALELATAELLRGDFPAARAAAARARDGSEPSRTRCTGPPPGRWCAGPLRGRRHRGRGGHRGPGRRPGGRSRRRRADPAAGHPDVAGLADLLLGR